MKKITKVFVFMVVLVLILFTVIDFTLAPEGVIDWNINIVTSLSVGVIFGYFEFLAQFENRQDNKDDI